MLRKDRKSISVDFCRSVLKDNQGNPNGSLCVARDMTQQKQAEAALLESNERYRMLSENLTDVVWTTDKNMRITYVSPSVTQQRGYTVEEAMSQSLQDMMPWSSLQTVTRVFTEALAKEMDNNGALPPLETIEAEMCCKDGSTIWTEITASHLHDAKGLPNGLLALTRDITERRNAELRVKEYSENLCAKAEEVDTLRQEVAELRQRLEQGNPSPSPEAASPAGQQGEQAVKEPEDVAPASPTFIADADDPKEDQQPEKSQDLASTGVSDPG
jgi:PAS domain S-box-containing protein